MAYLKLLTAAVLLLFVSLAHAGYAQLKPPSGFAVSSVPGQAGTFNFGKAANSSYGGGTVMTNAALSVAGTAVNVPVGMRLAANAATVGATFSFGNPALFVGITALALSYEWYNLHKLQVIGGQWQKVTRGKACTSGCHTFTYCHGTVCGYPSVDSEEAAQSLISAASSNFGVTWGFVSANESGVMVSTASDGHTLVTHYAEIIPIPPYDTTSLSPVSRSEFQQTFPSGTLVPDGIPQELPIDWPVQTPVINPSPSYNPSPIFVPTGNPVPTPDPNVWNQPGVRVVPAPTPDNPWRVDLQPETVPQNTPIPKTPAELNPVPSPSSPASAPVSVPVPSDKLGLCDQYPGIAACAPAATPEAKKKFCEENPDLLVCQPDETPDVPDLEKKNADISINPDSGWGSGGGSCPADRQLTHAVFSFQPYCDFASGIRPVLIAIAWFVGGFILIGHKAD